MIPRRASSGGREDSSRPRTSGIGGHAAEIEHSASRYHVYDAGDTLVSIARQYNASLPDLVRWNAIEDVRKLYAGTRLIVAPGNPDEPTAARKSTTGFGAPEVFAASQPIRLILGRGESCRPLLDAHRELGSQ